jgi:hypothetical protein
MDILHSIKRRKANWNGQISRRNWLLQHIIELKIDGTKRQGKRRKQLLDGLKAKSKWRKLKEKALDRTRRGSRFGRGYVRVARRTTEWMRESRWVIVVCRLSVFGINWLWPFEEWYNTFPWKYCTVGSFVQRNISTKLNNPPKKCRFESSVSIDYFTFSIVNLILYGKKKLFFYFLVIKFNIRRKASWASELAHSYLHAFM